MSDPGRNDPCPCGSGAKYKHCCLRKQKASRPSSSRDWRRRFEKKADAIDRHWGSSGLRPDDSRAAAEAALEAWEILSEHLPDEATDFAAAADELGDIEAHPRRVVKKGIDALLEVPADDRTLADRGADFAGEVLEQFTDLSEGRRHKQVSERIQLLIRAERYDEAEPLARELLDREPDRARSYALLSDILLEGDDPDPASAADLLEDALDQVTDDPKDWSLRDRLFDARRAMDLSPSEAAVDASQYYSTDEGQRAWEAFWEEFDAASLDDKFDLAHRAVGEAAFFDGEWAFRLLIEELAEPAAEHARYADWLEVADHIRDEHPGAVRDEPALSAKYVRMQLWNGGENLDEALEWLFERPADHLDHIVDTLETLAYHGHTDGLPDHMADGWSDIPDHSPMVGEYASWGVLATTARWAEQTPERTRDVEEFRETLGDLSHNIHDEYLEALGDGFLGDWNPDALLAAADQLQADDSEDDLLPIAAGLSRMLVEHGGWPPFKALVPVWPLFELLRMQAPAGDRERSTVSPPEGADGRRLREQLDETTWLLPAPELVAGLAEKVTSRTMLGCPWRAAALFEASAEIVDWLEAHDRIDRPRLADAVRHHLGRHFQQPYRSLPRLAGADPLLQSNLDALADRLG